MVALPSPMESSSYPKSWPGALLRRRCASSVRSQVAPGFSRDERAGRLRCDNLFLGMIARLSCGLAAVDWKRGACDPRGFVGREIRGEMRDFLRSSGASHGDCAD